MAAATRGARMPCTSCAIVPSVIFALLVITARCLADDSIRIPRPRGVSLEHASLYDRTKNFTCFDGWSEIDFSMVNDDYCDCEDGSDEPGTAACNNGKFHCNNLGHKGLYLPSSRVNDGICDCCDGSDEYSTSADCVNNCLELGRQAREEEERQRELLARGLQLQQQMASEGKKHRQDCKSKLEELRGTVEEARKSRDALEAVKKQAQDVENQALQKYRDIEAERKKEQEELEMKKHEEEEQAQAEKAFKSLDLDGDGTLTAAELQTNIIFDQNRDGTVSLEEAKFFLHMADSLDLEEFTTTGWMIMKPIYTSSKAPPTPAPESTPPPVVEPPEPTTPMPPAKEEEEDGHEDDEVPEDSTREDMETSAEEDEDEDVEPPKFPPKDEDEPIGEPPAPSADSTTEYDEETKALIEAAKKARDEFNEADTKVRDLESEISKLEKSLETDYGPEDAYAALREQCFEYTDREYTYKLCMFDQASQAPKAGGSDTSLGRWGSWNGPEQDKYSQMKYEGGATCWNGPTRSVVVDLHCGLENQLTSASEPNRCEYHFDFNTPAACKQVSEDAPKDRHVHEEL
ncbi:glucosidase 2 subunit beta isoform X2 [Haemaphysalis longicornis]